MFQRLATRYGATRAGALPGDAVLLRPRPSHAARLVRGAPSLDDDGYLWFEEYPRASTPVRVLNGHIAALYAYWSRAVTTGDAEAQRLFDGGATTALRYAEVLRRPRGYSAYSVRVPLQDAGYHDLHIRQLHQLAVLTVDERFEQLALEYEADRDAAR